MRRPIPFGRYLLLERLSVGGMAEVFLAKTFGVEGFQRLLAVKKILPTLVEDTEFATMFVDEARIAARLTHPGIVQVIDLGRAGETLYLVMEYVSGRDLRLLLDRLRKLNRRMPVALAAQIVMRVAEALDHAHRRTDAKGEPLLLVHRDVSPQNILVGFEGEVKLIDFGIAKAEGRSQRTEAGVLKGKFGYMSPEQVRGLPIDGRSDVFAAGAVLWECLTGEPLFAGESDFATLEKIRAADVPPVRDRNAACPEALEVVLLRALARDPEDRYGSAAELQQALAPFTHGSTSRDVAALVSDTLPEEAERERERLLTALAVEEPPAIPLTEAVQAASARSARTWAVGGAGAAAGALLTSAALWIGSREPAPLPPPPVAAPVAVQLPPVVVPAPEPPPAEVRPAAEVAAVPDPSQGAAAPPSVADAAKPEPRRAPARRTVDAKPAAPATGPGFLVLSSRPTAKVIVDGKDTGEWTPIPPGRALRLPVGARQVTLRTHDGRERTRTVEITAGETSRLINVEFD